MERSSVANLSKHRDHTRALESASRWAPFCHILTFSGFELYFELSEEVFTFSLLPIESTVVLQGNTGSLSQFCFKLGHDRVKPGVLLFGKLRFGPHAETIVWMQVKADSRRKIAQKAKDCGFMC
jgi:hypothetical protein